MFLLGGPTFQVDIPEWSNDTSITESMKFLKKWADVLGGKIPPKITTHWTQFHIFSPPVVAEILLGQNFNAKKTRSFKDSAN